MDVIAQNRAAQAERRAQAVEEDFTAIEADVVAAGQEAVATAAAPLIDQAEAARDAAQAAEDGAADHLAASTALMGLHLYTTTAAGDAAVAEGAPYILQGTSGGPLIGTLYRKIAGVGVSQGIEINSYKALRDLTAATVADGAYYFGHKQVFAADVDQSLIPANVTYLDRTRADYTRPEGTTVVNGLKLGDWDILNSDRYYIGYRQVEYAVAGQDLKPAQAVLLDGSPYVPPAPPTEWQTITDEGRMYAGYGEIIYAVVDASKKIGTAVRLDGSFYDPAAVIAEEPEPDPEPVPDAVLCLGDSITAGPYPEALAALSGRVVTKLAIGGQTSRHIVGRASAVGYRLTLQSNQIASGANVVTAINGIALAGMAGLNGTNVQFLSTGSGNGTYTATGYLGSIHGTLSRTATGGPPSTAEAYSFVPDGGYSLPITLPPETPFIADMAMDDRVIIAWLGRNNAEYPTQVLADFDAVFRRFGGQKLVMMNPLNGNYPAERATAADHSRYDYFRQIENTLAEKYPRNFLNIRRKMIDLGLGMLGITPTSQDLIDMADDTVPTSLRPPGDNVHPTTVCYQQVIAPVVNEYLIERGL